MGDEAADLARRGCRVTAFDISPTAVAWAQQRFPDLDVDWRVLDLLDLPGDLRGAFGLVVEVRTVQSLPASRRDDAMHAI
ncbi:SAM-dependent methyltransferase, partial [Enterococcus hirae]